jgi:N-acyl-D-aspartate/D-glutamate deacylase
VRDRKLFLLEEAVHKLSGKSAARYGLAGRGVVREGAFADLVVFDPATITDRATYERPQQPCVGVEYVAVNGRFAVDHAAPVADERVAGRYLRRS